MTFEVGGGSVTGTLAQLVERKVPGSNPIGDIAFFGNKTC